MQVEIYLYASLSRYAPDRSSGKRFLMEIKEGVTIRDVLTLLKVTEDVVKIIFVNGVHADGDAIVTDGDRLAFFPPVAGG
ncbi:MAG: MoaD/ThiS family protein [Deltaproteobacteria bacterium]|nr:MoaD/ThiS family protein [Deltaproteobacteria bacterium]